MKKETRCWICKEKFDDKDVKDRDHCHFTGRYRGAAHNLCNLNHKKPNFTPVVFHNLSGYDSHLFIKNLGFSKGNIYCIPNNEEKYISFNKNIQVGSYTSKKGEIKPLHHQIRFIDSFKFMATSLDKLVDNLPKDNFNNVKKHYADDKLSLLTKEGIYPYENRYAGKVKLNYRREKHFILNLLTKVSVMRITRTLDKFGKRSR